MSDPPPSDRPVERPMTIVEATLWAIGTMVALQIVWDIAVSLRPDLARDFVLDSISQIVAYLALLWVIQTVYFPRTAPAVVFAARPGRWVFYPIAVLLGLSIQFPVTALYHAIVARWPVPDAAAGILDGFVGLPLWRKVALGAGLMITTPLIEEAFFRGALLGGVRRHHKVLPTILVVGALFGFIHLRVQPHEILPIAFVGAALALLRIASGSLWPGVVMHAVFNSMTFFVLVLKVPDPSEHASVALVVGGTIVTAGLLALVDHLRDRRPDEIRSEEEDTL